MPTKWTDTEDAVLRSHWGKYPLDEIAARITNECGTERTPIAVLRHSQRLGLRNNERQWWTAQENARLAKLWGTMISQRIADALTAEFGRDFTANAVRVHASRLRLNRRNEG